MCQLGCNALALNNAHTILLAYVCIYNIINTYTRTHTHTHTGNDNITTYGRGGAVRRITIQLWTFFKYRHLDLHINVLL